MGFDGWAGSRRLRMLLAGMTVLLIAGCGSIGSDNKPAPTATATVWPTVGSSIDAASPEASPPWQMASTPESAPSATAAVASADATPAGAGASTPSTPEGSVVVVATVPVPGTPDSTGTPVATSGGAASASASPQAETTRNPTAPAEPTAATVVIPSTPVVQAANPETGDGTSGPPAVADLGARTPLPADSRSTPGASPQASPGARVIVTSCDPAQVPPVVGDTSYITTSDVNIRIGPGTDCDLAADILPQGTLLTLTSGEVVRDGQNGTTWVRVDTNGISGWVSTEFITPDGQ
ncbi:MAG: hypothetical protein WBA46_13530 [Thermomicrobiales bacterium]